MVNDATDGFNSGLKNRWIMPKLMAKSMVNDG